ncbi:unnamed protein product [Plutella xylostella]|uniref:(diamondback moth) hypothetical protein n=1 Tax=Plutella xylostella TaxID=51655 RepID=A0A8S4F4B0_PLUXY|nr:unnamed protein product [Plutella xylostella]
METEGSQGNSSTTVDSSQLCIGPRDSNFPHLRPIERGQGRRRKGRPAITWRRSILSDLNAVGISWDEAKERAQDRNVWRKTVEALYSSWS